jgi:hypothetical protein
MKERRINEIKPVFKKVFDIEPDEFNFYEGDLHAEKTIGNVKSYPFIRLTVAEVYKCRVPHQDWRFDVCYDGTKLVCWIKKYENVEGKLYKYIIEIHVGHVG